MRWNRRWLESGDRARGRPELPGVQRQNLPHQSRTDEQVQRLRAGATCCPIPPARSRCDPDRHRFGSGSGHAGHAHPRRRRRGCARGIDALHPGVRCQEPIEYREGVLPDWCRKRVAIEAGVSDFWRKYVGLDGAVIGIDSDRSLAAAFRLHRAEASVGRAPWKHGYSCEAPELGSLVPVSFRHIRRALIPVNMRPAPAHVRLTA
jgi:transketolase